MRLFSALALAGLSILGTQAMSSMELIKNMKIGWSLGNTLDANCADTLNYASDQTASETCWGNVKTTEGLFTALMKQGFDTFRIPTTWDGHFGDGPSYTINSAWMKRVREVVDYGYKNGAYVILNIHHEKWNYAFANNLQKAQTILVAIWKQIATEFADYDEHLIFEGLNEPRKVGDAVEWTGGDSEGWDFVNQMNALFVKTIRGLGGKNAKRHLMIPTYAATTQDGAINAFKFPSGDSNLIVSLHAYTPYNFALNNGDGAVSTFSNQSELDSLFNLIKSKFISQNIPVIIGEFGAMSRNNDAERAKWAEAYTKGAKAIGVPCVVWDNGVFEGSGERFGLIDRTSYQIKAPQVVNGFMKGIGSTGPVTPTNKPAPAPGNAPAQDTTPAPAPAQDNNNNSNNNSNDTPVSPPAPIDNTNNNNTNDVPQPPAANPPEPANNNNNAPAGPSFDGGFPGFGGNNNNGGGFPGFGGNNNGGGFPGFGGNNNGGGFPGFGGNNNGGGFPGFGGNNNGGGFPGFGGNNNGGGFPGFGGNNNGGGFPVQPAVPETPAQPEAPTQPETPAVPETPAQPEAPTQPETPAVPETPVQPEAPTQPEAPVQPEAPTQLETPAVPETPAQPEAPTSSQVSGDYFSCAKDDWSCKQGMADKCYKEADKCYTSSQDYQKCADIITNCNKIWKN